jgi:hypothetical protein
VGILDVATIACTGMIGFMITSENVLAMISPGGNHAF